MSTIGDLEIKVAELEHEVAELQEQVRKHKALGGFRPYRGRYSHDDHWLMGSLHAAMMQLHLARVHLKHERCKDDPAMLVEIPF